MKIKFAFLLCFALVTGGIIFAAAGNPFVDPTNPGVVENPPADPVFWPLTDQDHMVQEVLVTYDDAYINRIVQDAQQFRDPMFVHRAIYPRDVVLEERKKFLETPLIQGPEMLDIFQNKYIPALCIEDLSLFGLNMAEICFDARSINTYLNDTIDQLTYAIVKKEQPLNALLKQMISEEEPTEEFAVESIATLMDLILDGMKTHPSYKKNVVNYLKNRLPALLTEYLKRKTTIPLFFKRSPKLNHLTLSERLLRETEQLNNDIRLDLGLRPNAGQQPAVPQQNPPPPDPQENIARPCPLNRVFPLSLISPWPVIAPFMNSFIANKGLPSKRKMIPYITWNLAGTLLEGLARPLTDILARYYIPWDEAEDLPENIAAQMGSEMLRNLASPAAYTLDALAEKFWFIACTEIVFNTYFFHFGINKILTERITSMLLKEGNNISTLLSAYEKKRERPTMSTQDAEEHRKILVGQINSIVKKHLSGLQPDIFLALRTDHAKFKIFSSFCLRIPLFIKYIKKICIILNFVSQPQPTA